jgi:membrane protein YqaA with SNARE-associated domain
MKEWFTDLKIRVAQLADTKWGTGALFIFAFADASFLPLPITTFFLLLVALKACKSIEYTISVTFGTLAGAFFAFFIGQVAWFAPDGEYTGLAQFVFNHFPGFSENAYNKLHVIFTKWNIWVLFAAAPTPVPYGILALFSGIFEVNIIIFLFATLISQGIKFIFLAFMTLKLRVFIRRLSVSSWRPVVFLTSVCIAIVLFTSNTFKNLFQIN